MKKILLRILGCILVLISIALICYPFISNYLEGLNQQSKIVEYEDKIVNTNAQELEKEYQRAVEYNKSLLGEVVITDPFDPAFTPATDGEYDDLINIFGDGIMGYVEIPVIKLNLPVYHGTSEQVLLKGSGHLQNTSMPVGGDSTHAVLTGHTGLSSAKLFTDINLMQIGDIFYVHILGKTLAYKVDKISVVKPNETEALRVSTNHDYMTLVTCTPYGINTHRLFVRGTRIPYNEALAVEQDPVDSSESTWMREYKKALFAGAIILIVIITLFLVIRRFILRKRRSSIEGEQ